MLAKSMGVINAEEAVENPILIPAEHVAQLLGISKRTLWRLLSAGRLPEPRRLGSIVRWQREELEAWIGEGCPPVGEGDN